METRINPEETVTLLDVEPEAPAPGWFSRTISRVVNVLKSGVSHVYHHPISSVLAFVTATPNTINALVGPSGINPANLGPEWWNNMTNFQRVYSITCSLSSQTINTIMNAMFLPLAKQKLVTGIKQIRTGCSAATQTLTSILLGASAGIAAGAIGYNAFLWLPAGKFTAVPIALANLLINFASRFISIVSIFGRISIMLNANSRQQGQFADELSHINPDYLFEVEDAIQEILHYLYPHHDETPLTQEEYQRFLTMLAVRLNVLRRLHPDLMLDHTNDAYCRAYAATICNIAFAVTVSVAGYLTFTQKGFDGINIFSTLLSKRSLEDIPAALQALMGSLSGIASFMFYANNGFNFTNNMVLLCKHLYREPQHLPKTLLIFAANACACISMTTVARGVVKNPHNIFGFEENALSYIYITDMTIAGALTNTNSSIEKALLPTHTDPKFSDISLPDVIQFLQNKTSHSITTETASMLRRYSLFATPVQDENIRANFEMSDRELAVIL